MQAVSKAWIENQAKPLVSESFVELVYEIGDPESLADATAFDNGSAYFSNTDTIVNEIDETMIRYATFEQNFWKMDGSYRLLPEESPYTGTGFVSDTICDANGLFTKNPVITISFSKVYSKVIPGITIRWGRVYEDYADTFKVTVYNGDTAVKTVEISGNTEVITQIIEDIVDYDKITVEIIKWGTPYRRARIEEIFIGVKRVFGKEDIVSYQHTMSVDLLSGKLPKNEIKFEIINLNGEYNPLNLDSQAKYLIERQRIIAKYGFKIDGNIEWIKAGAFYLNEWDLPQNGFTATFTARDLLEFMNTNYTTTVSNKSLYDLAIEVLTLANLPLNRDGSVKWVLDESLKNIMVKNAELDNTLAEVLQMIANAGCCVIYQDRNEKLHIEPVTFVLSDYVISRSNSYKESELTLTKKLKSVNVNKGMAIVTNGADGEEQRVENPLISASQAETVAMWVKEILKNRMIFKGEYRADPRLDPLDMVTVVNQYGSKPVVITEVVYKYNGAFRGTYEGRVIE